MLLALVGGVLLAGALSLVRIVPDAGGGGARAEGRPASPEAAVALPTAGRPDGGPGAVPRARSSATSALGGVSAVPGTPDGRRGPDGPAPSPRASGPARGTPSATAGDTPGPDPRPGAHGSQDTPGPRPTRTSTAAPTPPPTAAPSPPSPPRPSGSAGPRPRLCLPVVRICVGLGG
ncbi:hypothetical protein [Streptomyces sp. ACT015]|uniref:hypothetical protein n=1 Tax=Streptomyces sp. ACT015 TaxID=3134807 RepID=UPI003D167F14